MNRTHHAWLYLALTLSVASCGSSGSAGTGAGGGGVGGSGGAAGQGGETPDASGDVASPAMDAGPDRVVTCEGRDGNACSAMPDAQACQRCVQSCCCDPVAACRADANCAAAIGLFNDCLQEGNLGVACLVPAVQSLTDPALFVSIADCVDMECGDLTCPL